LYLLTTQIDLTTHEEINWHRIPLLVTT